MGERWLVYRRGFFDFGAKRGWKDVAGGVGRTYGSSGQGRVELR